MFIRSVERLAARNYLIESGFSSSVKLSKGNLPAIKPLCQGKAIRVVFIIILIIFPVFENNSLIFGKTLIQISCFFYSFGPFNCAISGLLFILALHFFIVGMST